MEMLGTNFLRSSDGRTYTGKVRIDWIVHEKVVIVLEGAVIPDPKASIAIFEINISPGYCIVCTFEENHLCGYNNRWNPNLNWLVGGGSVRNSPTNLPTDHTWDNEHGHYMYVDAIYTTSLHEVAQLLSPVTTSALSGCLSFFYQLEQSRSNLFIVYTKDRMEHYEEVWRSNKSTHNWSLVTVNVKASHPFQVVFEVAFSSTKGGYAALDDISFSSQFCNNRTELVFDPSVANCDFDQGLCNYSQSHNDGTKWTRLVRKANAFRFGDHTSGEDFGQICSHLEIVFVSVCKNFWNCGKVALDDITVSQGDCRIPGGSWLPTPGKCSFDGDNCGFVQDHDDKGNWYRRTGTTPTSFTGPKGDHTTGVDTRKTLPHDPESPNQPDWYSLYA
ncbi:hypothetical protein scyTo_0002400 [Scyliorhinus torazame]|uniref:MAM domain-containing protein n=1 Tax=Scyliorhinus torazame TaxID=75743 RepID=A0A401PJ89_SCYTO|nr:hypothetical protein [Scyliorhinus torazame]